MNVWYDKSIDFLPKSAKLIIFTIFFVVYSAKIFKSKINYVMEWKRIRRKAEKKFISKFAWKLKMLISEKYVVCSHTLHMISRDYLEKKLFSTVELHKDSFKHFQHVIPIFFLLIAQKRFLWIYKYLFKVSMSLLKLFKSFSLLEFFFKLWTFLCFLE